MHFERKHRSSTVRPVAIAALVVALLGPTTAYAASESLARCNRTRAMAALGIPVAGSDAAACGNIVPAAFGTDEVSLRASIGRVAASVSFPAVVAVRPGWLDGGDSDSQPNLVYGVGAGATVQDAFREATIVLAGQLSTTVYSRSETRSVAATGYVSSSTGVGMAAVAGLAVRTDTSRIIISGTLQDVRVSGIFQDPSSRQFFVRVSLDPRDTERHSDAVGEAGFELMARATGRFLAVIQEAGLTEDAARVLLDAQSELAQLARSPWGRSGGTRWRNEERELRRLVEFLQSCAELRFGAFNSPDPAMAPIPASATEFPPLIAQNTLVGRLVCGEQPLRGVRFRITVEGGMASFPDNLRTGPQGDFQLNIESVRGAGQVRLVLRPQYTESEYRQGGAVVGMTTTRSADYRIEIRGLAEGEAGGLREAIRAMAVRRWNAREVDVGSPAIRCVIQVDVPTATAVMGRVSQPVSLAVSFGAEQGTIFERRHQSAFLGNSPEESRRGAIASLESVVQSW